MRFRYLSLAVFLIASCAHPVAPDGGPEDKTGPKLQSYFPAQNQTNLSRKPNLVFQFSEWIDPAGTAKVMISPPSAQDPKAQIGGSWLKVVFPDSLDSATTYTLSLSRSIKDFRGNAIEDPFSLTFSTGSSLDSLKFSGRLLASDSSQSKLQGGYIVGLYPLGDSRRELSYLDKLPDSIRPNPRPSIERPMYQVSPNPEGFFAFQGLKPGQYRLFGFQDQNGDGKFQKAEKYAFAEKDLLLPNDTLPLLLVTQSDRSIDSLRPETISPLLSLTGHDSLDRLKIIWNKECDSTCNLVSASPVGDTTQVITFRQNYLSRDRKTSWFEFPHHTFAKDSTYLFSGLGTKKMKLRWTPDTDSLAFGLLWSTPSNGDEWVAPSDTIKLGFEAPWIVPLDSQIKIKFEQEQLRFKTIGMTPTAIGIIPEKPFPEGSTLRLWKYGPTAKDSVQLLKISIFEPKAMAQFTGRIDEPGEWIVQLLADSSTRVYTHKTTAGKFKFQNIPPGFYHLQYFQDRDGDGRYTQGREHPFMTAEPFVRLAESLQLIAGSQDLLDLLRKSAEKRP